MPVAIVANAAIGGAKVVDELTMTLKLDCGGRMTINFKNKEELMNFAETILHTVSPGIIGAVGRAPVPSSSSSESTSSIEDDDDDTTNLNPVDEPGGNAVEENDDASGENMNASNGSDVEMKSEINDDETIGTLAVATHRALSRPGCDEDTIVALAVATYRALSRRARDHV